MTPIRRNLLLILLPAVLACAGCSLLPASPPTAPAASVAKPATTSAAPAQCMREGESCTAKGATCCASLLCVGIRDSVCVQGY